MRGTNIEWWDRWWRNVGAEMRSYVRFGSGAGLAVRSWTARACSNSISEELNFEPERSAGRRNKRTLWSMVGNVPVGRRHVVPGQMCPWGGQYAWDPCIYCSKGIEKKKWIRKEFGWLCDAALLLYWQQSWFGATLRCREMCVEVVGVSPYSMVAEKESSILMVAKNV